MRHNLGTVRPGSTIYLPFDTFDRTNGAPVTMTGFAVGDIQVYKDGGTTQRASTSGYTLLDTDGIDFDAITGLQGYSIDLSDNTTAGFWTAGSRYMVAISTVTVDAQTMSFWHATFRIGYEGATIDTTIATLSTQTSFTLTAGPAEDSALNGCQVVIHDIASAVQHAYGQITGYTGASKTVTLGAASTFTVAAGDNISIFRPALLSTVLGNTVDVNSAGEVGLDWSNVGNKTATVDLANTTIATTQKVDVNTIKTQTVTLSGGVTIPAATLASTTNITGGTVTTATNVTTVNGFAVGAITNAAFAAGAIDNAAIATDAIGSAELAASAVTEIQTGLSTLDAAGVRSAVGLASANLDTQLAPVANLPSGIKKNTALSNFEFLMVLASDHYSAATGLTVTATRSIDGAAFGACTNAVAEVSSGIYKINLSASDLNGDTITLRFASATADDRFVTIITEP